MISPRPIFTSLLVGFLALSTLATPVSPPLSPLEARSLSASLDNRSLNAPSSSPNLVVPRAVPETRAQAAARIRKANARAAKATAKAAAKEKARAVKKAAAAAKRKATLAAAAKARAASLAKLNAGASSRAAAATTAAVAAAAASASAASAAVASASSSATTALTSPLSAFNPSSARALASFQRYRCKSNEICAVHQDKFSLPANGQATCNLSTFTCQVGCVEGYLLNFNTCVPTETSCGPNGCRPLSNGINVCSGNNVCTPVCDASLNYVLSTSGTTCLLFINDANNCGSEGNVCPESYTASGTPWCRRGACTLACPLGEYPTTTSGGLSFCQ